MNQLYMHVNEYQQTFGYQKISLIMVTRLYSNLLSF